MSRANDICRRANEQIRALDQPTDPGELDAYMGRLQSITDRLIEDLRGLEPPEGDEARIDRMLANLEDMRGYLPEIQEAAREQDTRRIEELAERVGRATREVQQSARAYGLEECSGDAVGVPG